MEDEIIGKAIELKDTVVGAASAVAGWAASLNFEEKWKKVIMFVGVAVAIVVILNILI